MSSAEEPRDARRDRTVDWITLGVLIGIPILSWGLSRWALGSESSADGAVGAFGDGPRFAPQAAFPWAIIGELAFVVHAYSVAIRRKDWSAVLVSLTVWIGEMIWEMVNGVIRHELCYPLFGFQGQTAWQMYPGLTIEISLMFAVVPLVLFNLLPKDQETRIKGIRSRLLVPFLLGVFCIVVELLLNRSGALVWTWYFWKSPYVGVAAFSYYLPFLVMAQLYDRLKGKDRLGLYLLGAVVLAFVVCHFTLPHSSAPVPSCPEPTRFMLGPP